MKISISKEDLMEPTCEWVKNALENFIEFFSGKNIEFICQPKFNALNCFLHPELHEESIGFIVKHRFFQDLSFSSGYREFSLRDYFFPTFPKVRKIFSAVINFAKFREEFILFLKNFSKIFNKSFVISLENFIKLTFLELKINFLIGGSDLKKVSHKKFKKMKVFFTSLIRRRHHFFSLILKITRLKKLKFWSFTDRFLMQKKQDYVFNELHFEKISLSVYKIGLPILINRDYIGNLFYKLNLILNSIKKKSSYRINKFKMVKLNLYLFFEVLMKIKNGKTSGFLNQHILKNKIHCFINQKQIIKKNFRKSNRIKNKNEIYMFYLKIPKNLRKTNKLIFIISNRFQSFKRKPLLKINEPLLKPDSISRLIFQILIARKEIKFLKRKEF